ncbi:hypothetical protein [Aquimarina sp. 2201CG5-10]|uniref:leucine-rich repeat domain-containing protein n=1 Tax=Aquimarina callyspongiae TaxID=3098150 RepID=UPI002AB41D20|nr:hypothetical protein [Aquimarina sp. 2201CG5-10]MDY8138495.1 hypothetical protein [Aquimarina sp. 2201CG5-10]
MKNLTQIKSNFTKLTLLTLLTIFGSINLAAQVSSGERQALIDFYNATNGDNWTNTTANNEPWLINDSNSQVTDWYGVSVVDGKVVGLSLFKNNIDGQIPNSFGDLINLKDLTLSSNKLTGAFPQPILQLSNLTRLALSKTELSGTIPPSLFTNLPKLVYLYLNQNSFTGIIPAEIGLLTDVIFINLGLNQLTGTIPNELGQLTKVTSLYLNNNQLSGTIPNAIGNMTSLKTLSLYRNKLTGSIPASISSLSELTSFSLYLNKLSGPIPDGIGNLSKLKLIHFAFNDLSGSIPSSVGNLSKITFFNLEGNELTGSIPPEIVNISNLQRFNVSNNNLTGAVPAGFENLPFLQFFRIDRNNLEGNITLNTTTQPNIIGVEIEDNNFVFSNFEANFDSYVTKLGNSFKYTPQAKVDQTEALVATENGSITLTSTSLTSSNNTYQWFKDGVAIAGATNKDLVLTNVTNADAGEYHFTVTNSTINNLTLERNPITLTVTADTCGVSAAQRQALIDLYNSTDGPNWTAENNWLSNAPVCDWTGVTVVDGKVTKLYLFGGGVSGPLPESIGDLIHLTSLTITRSYGLSGSIPSTIGNLTNLTGIDLFGNQLTGSIPVEIGNLTNLISLRLGRNQLSGNIPSSIGNLINLTSIEINENGLTGDIPPSIGNLTALENFNVAINQLNGPIPTELGNLVNLTTLGLTRNALTGTIPSSLSNLTNLATLNLSINQLTGSIPAELGTMTNLVTLNVGRNQLSGSIPQELGSLQNLVTLDLSSNTFTGEIPVTFENLSNLTGLHLNRNQLSGSIPEGIAALSKLSALNLSTNQLSGKVPVGLTALASSDVLNTLTLERNNFVFNDFESEYTTYSNELTTYNYLFQAKVDQTETLPVLENGSITLSSTALTSLNNSYQWYKNNTVIPGATSKEYTIQNATLADAGIYHFTATNNIITDLTLTRNAITLTVTEDTCGVSAAEKQALIDLYNSTNGPNWTNNTNWNTNAPVCDWFGVTVVDGKVTKISLINNGLLGTIPDSFGNLTNLDYVAFAINQLSGSLPASIGNLINVETFSVERNAMTGTIPTSIGNMTALKVLILGSNQFTGSIPSSLGNLSNLTTLNLFRNQLDGSIPSELGNLSNLTTLNLFSNQLAGEIPTSLGSLSNLLILNLYLNQLSGSIPTELGNLSNLTTLGLSSNNLSGTIPSSLGSLSALSVMNLYSNSLTGSIPAEFSQLTELTILNLYRNQLSGTVPTGIGNLSKLATLGLSTNQLSGEVPSGLANLASSNILNVLTLDTNNFVFNDFESEYANYSNELTTFNYLLQAKVDQTETLSVLENGSITLSSTALTSPNNSYQWFKDGVAIAGATSKDYVISNAANADAGVYHFTATNSIIADLTLVRNPITLTINPDTCGVSESERQALWDLYISSNGQNWTNTLANNQPWDLGIPVCDWYGVTVVDGRVTVLNLENNNLQGTIPSSISNLLHLTSLDLNTNQLIGEIPSSMGALLELTYLSMHHNSLSGVLSPSLGSLSNLIVMDLSFNMIQGVIPIAFCNLSNLEILNLSANQLSGGIPKELGILVKLKRLDLRNNNFSGNIPSQLVALSNLEYLGLSDNKLSGFIPFTVGQNSKLEEFVFENNKFIFSNFENKHLGYTQNLNVAYQYIPQAKTDEIETKTVTSNNAITLTTILSSENNSYQWFKDNVVIPGATSREYTIQNATLADAGVYHFTAINNVIEGLTLERNPITLEVKETCTVAITERQALINLYNAVGGANWTNTLANNQSWLINDANSSICDWYGVIVQDNKVVELNLNNNNLTGTLPDVFANLPSLKKINFSNNKLGGAVPLSLTTITTLETLAIEHNGFVFEDFETQFSNYASINFSYTPQDKVDTPDSQSIAFGGTFTLTSTQLTSTNNQYQWFKNGLPINGATSKDLVITNATQDDSGMYFFEATNTVITGLTLIRNPISIEVRAEGDNCGVSDIEKQALIDLYNSTDGANWTNNTNWLTDTPVCDWFGVTVVDGKVKELKLSRNNLTGEIPSNIGNQLINIRIFYARENNISGLIPESFGNASLLEGLDLHNNNLEGSIPISVLELNSLYDLALSNNNLSGNINSRVGTQPNLRMLLLNNNQLNGEIPITLGQALKLGQLDLSHNNFTGSILEELGTLIELQTLILNNNKFNGEIPRSLNSNSSKLFRINFSNNELSGTIPAELFNIPNLKELILIGNELSGVIPTEVSQAQLLRSLLISNNKLRGSIPGGIDQLPDLQQFYLETNNFVFNNIENEFNNLKSKLGTSFRYSPQAKVDETEIKSIISGQSITLSSTALTSTNNSYQWYKDGAAITGAVTKDLIIENASNSDAGVYHFTATNSIVTDLTLERNTITLEILASGACEVSDADRQALIDFYQTTNGDGWTNTTDGNQAWLINDPTSKVCDWFGVTVSADYKIENIELPNNNLRGEIPASLEILDDLKVLNLALNNMIGEIPVSLTNMPNLQTLNLRENVLVGAIPEAISNLANLQVLDLGGNRFSSVIPTTIGGLQNLTYLDLSLNKLEDVIPEGLYTIAPLQTIKLQENNLTGGVSNTIGNLLQLEVFWLSKNNFTGSIPGTITSIPGLYSVHLDFNSFGEDLPLLIPNLNTPNADVQINDNRFVFSDFEPEHPGYRDNLINYTYIPQARVDRTEIITVEIGGSARLFTDDLTSPNNTYRWFKDNEFLIETTLREINIDNITEADLGTYYFTSTNSTIEGLVLERNRITLRLEDVVNPPVDNIQSFCLAENDEPTIGDLISPFPGQTQVSWFETETGGTALSSDTEILETTVFWAESNSANSRIAVQAVLDEGITGYDFEELDFQSFEISSNPTIANLQPQGADIRWFDAATGGLELTSITALEDGKEYYAQQGNGTCRFGVGVFVGVLEPEGDGWQSFCASEDATVANLQERYTILNNHQLVWYRAETGDATYTLDEGLINGGEYFVVQKDSDNNESSRKRIIVTIFDVPAPYVAERVQTFYTNESVFVSDLVAIGNNIIWYDAPFGGTAYDSSERLIDGATYYAAQTNINCRPGDIGCCTSTFREEVTVRITEELPPSLVGCVRFRPQPGARYVISAWVREDGLEAINPVTKNFSEESNVFVSLLNHLLNDKIMASLPENRHIPSVYIPKPDTREFDVLVPFIKNATDKNLTIYNFEYIKERQNGVGPEKTVGFEFALTSESNAPKFSYKTPRVRNRQSGSLVLESYRYPLLSNPTLDLEFREASVCGSSFCTKTNFSIQGEGLSHSENGASQTNAPTSLAFSSIEAFTYVSNPNYQVMDYANSLLRLRYRNSQGVDIPQETRRVEFRPKGAIIDGWQRVSADFTIPLEATNMVISLESNIQGDASQLLNVYFDDLRMHPFDGNMKTFVYDPITQRLQSELDENNYATFYEYDQEGGLIRVKKETERGVFTIQETRSGNSKLNNAQE